MAALFESHKQMRTNHRASNLDVSYLLPGGLKAGSLFFGNKRLSREPEFAAVFHFQQFDLNLITF
jgi:hypothetical protein